jgi:hypothetical protein
MHDKKYFVGKNILKNLFSILKNIGSGANLECCQNIHKNMRVITNVQSLKSIKIRIFILISEQLILMRI